MTDEYNAPFQDEITQILTAPNPESGKPPISVISYNLRKRIDGSIVQSDVFLEMINEIVQEGSWNNAAVMNNFVARDNAMAKNLANVMLIVNTLRRVQSSGTDNLEIMGINDDTELFMRNNHSDFGILAENSIAGMNQIKILNASGYRFEEMLPVALNISPPAFKIPFALNPSFITSDSVLLDNGQIVYMYSAGGTAHGTSYNTWQFVLFDPLLNTTFLIFNGSVGMGDTQNLIKIKERNMFGFRADGEGKISIRDCNSNTSISSNAAAARYTSCIFYSKIDNTIYGLQSVTAPNTILLATPSVLPATLTPAAISLSRTVRTLSTGNIGKPLAFCYVSETERYCIGFSSNGGLYELNNNYQELLLHPSVLPTPFGYVNSMIRLDDSYLAVIFTTYRPNNSSWDSKLIKFNRNGIRIDLASYEEIILPFLNGRKVLNVWNYENIAYISGTDGLLAYSLNGDLWTEIIMNNPNFNDAMLSVGITVGNSIYNICRYNNDTIPAIANYESFNPDNFKNKKYVLNTESVLIDSVNLLGSDIVLGLDSPLIQNHNSGELLRRTNNSTIPPNSTVNVTVEFDNLFSHNAVVLFPQFTNLQNVSINAQVSKRNTTDELENFENIPLVHEVELNADWREQTYFLKYPTDGTIFAASFTITNNNPFAIELWQLTAILFDEVYEMGA
jgi:hypothetical protein